MNEAKQIIVEFGAQRQRFTLTDQLISTLKLRHLIGNHFRIKLDTNSVYTLQIYDKRLNEYYSLNDDKKIFNLMKDIEQLHRFRIINKSFQTQKYHLLNNLQSTAGKLHSATRDIDKLRNLIGTLNHSCDTLNQLMDTHCLKSSSNQFSSVPSYLLDPSTTEGDIDVTEETVDNDWDEENFESVSYYDSASFYTKPSPPSMSTILNLNKQQSSMTNNNIQTRIIPCKYAVRGTCHLGDKCSYLHDEACIQSAREWERRFDDDDDDDDDDAESSHSDCLIIESNISTSQYNDSNFHLTLTNTLPNSLPKQTNLFLIYENRTMDVHLVTPIVDLEKQERITISHLNYLYSIPKRHLYLSIPCNIQRTHIPRQSRIMYISTTSSSSSSTTKKFSLGFICEVSSIHNHLRHLILFDDGTAKYTMENDLIYLCLCQDFERNSRSIESKLMRQNFEKLLSNKCLNKQKFHIHNYVRVKKFDDKYHNARIIDVDCSIIKLKFYERQAQTEIWMHQHSLLIDDTIIPPIDIASPVILQNKRKYDEISTISRSSSPVSIRSFPSNVYQSHQCSPHCVLTAEENFIPNCIIQNPYTLPFSCGWKYFHIDRYAKDRFKKKPSTRKTISSRSNYLYRSPCGRSFLTLDEIEQYLLQTNSKLTIKFFVDDRTTRLESCIKYESKYILYDDITQEKEYVRIPVYNENNSNLPESFIYGTETRSKLIFSNDTTTMTCCSCTDNCRNRIKCPCWLKTFEQAKLNENEQILNWQRQNLSDEQMIIRFAYIHQRLKIPVWSGIYECNSKCLCHTKQCTNRLVQNSLYQQLQLFHTNTKGWALRVLHDIPYGSFINAYVGELITEQMAAKRDFKYLAILDHKSHLTATNNKNRKESSIKNKLDDVRILNAKNRIPVKCCIRSLNDTQTDNEDDDNDEDDDDSCFILDAKHYGSISRFYNHSCKPNVHIQNVFINSHDPRFPVIALFACRNIRAGEEICWDYNYSVGCMPNVRIDCQCQASNCRGRLL
ncbi:unnamed protein product [Rotaria sordida]|uniref:Uncharacterized protein n=1 Tax=Rotaria sordida TaxID=392033 RepID=A0A813RQK3_9BILA|nr:unnamed protein product [Rotaria sordida]